MTYEPAPPFLFRYRGELRPRRAGRLAPDQIATCPDGHPMTLDMRLDAGRGSYACKHTARSGDHLCNAMLYYIVRRGRVHFAADLSYDDVKYMEQESFDLFDIAVYLGLNNGPFPIPPQRADAAA